MTPDLSLLAAAAQRLRDAAAAGEPCEPARSMTGGDITPEAGYQIQQINTDHWRAESRRVSGHKVGLTNPAVQRQLGVGQPVWGVLFADNCRSDGADIGGEGLIEPRVEVEVAVVLGDALDSGRHTVADAINATAYVLPALEIVDSRINWDITAGDMIADSAGAGLYVLGTRPVELSKVDLRRAGMRLDINGEHAASGTGAACMGNPLNALVWLADALCDYGAPLQAGECVMTGSLCGMLPISDGDELLAEIDGVGVVSAALRG
ncbi:MAG: fumarylacetoacetate hydrolase family protein [Acidimicrobiaceae bacterium]|nr:fumarylacetoacetate hydrolase family protein [Acidimicrobiaceae bacterium]